jgi:hypothetical protein
MANPAPIPYKPAREGRPMAVVRWLVRLVVLLVVLVMLVFVAARFHDGPLGPIPGGPLAEGPLVTEAVQDWSFAAGVDEIELQLASQATSRTTWILVHEGGAYVPAAVEFPPGKTWHRAALADGRATLRIAGRRYPVTLTKVEDGTLVAAVREVGASKYPDRPSGEAWLFRVESRPAE